MRRKYLNAVGMWMPIATEHESASERFGEPGQRRSSNVSDARVEE
jgi:hypothetical protein